MGLKQKIARLLHMGPLSVEELRARGAVIGENCIVAAGALVPQNMVIPPRSLVMGSPAKVRREVTEEEIAANRLSAEGYVREAAEYKEMFAK